MTLEAGAPLTFGPATITQYGPQPPEQPPGLGGLMEAQLPSGETFLFVVRWADGQIMAGNTAADLIPPPAVGSVWTIAYTTQIPPFPVIDWNGEPDDPPMERNVVTGLSQDG